MYGGNAMFGVINVITRSGRNVDGTELGVGAASRKTYDGRVTEGQAVGDKEWLVSASKGNSSGGSYEFADIAPGVKTVNNADAENWQRLFGKLSSGDWHASLVYGNRQKFVPTGSVGTIFNDPNHHEDDNFIIADINKLHRIDDKQDVYVRVFSGQYKYLAHWPFVGSPSVIGDENVTGRWQGMEGRWTSSAWSNQRWITGLEYTHNQTNFNYVETLPSTINLQDQGSTSRVGLYAQDEIAIAETSHLTLGLRRDQSSGYTGSWSPRLAFAHQADQANTYKILYGTAYRDPDFFANLSPLNHTALKPEQIQTLEGIWQHRLGANTSLMANLFENHIKNALQQDSNFYYFNAALITTRGGELEWVARYDNDTQLRLSYTLQSTNQEGVVPDNSPMKMFKANIGLPIASNWTSGLEVQGMSNRQTASGAASVSAFTIANLTLGYHSPDNKWLMTGSIYNLFDRQYSDPISLSVTSNSLAQDGRLFRLKFETHF